MRITKLPILSAVFFCVFSILCGCTTPDPLIGKAEATLKGCEFGPPDELLSDLKKAEAYIKNYDTTLKELTAAKFFETPKAEVMPSLIVETNGDVKRAEVNYELLATIPIKQAQLKTLVGSISQRLTKMEEVRKKSNYAQKVQLEGKLNQDLKAAQQSNSNYLENQRSVNANFYNSLDGYDYVSYKNSYGTTYTESTLKGKIREQTLLQEKLLDQQIELSRKQIAESKQAAASAMSNFSKNNESFESIKDYISNESDKITLETWPKLKATMKELEDFAAANADLAK